MSAFWDRMAKRYAASPMANVPAYQATLSSVRSHLTPTSRVLEIGCGSGNTVLNLAPHAGHIVGTDFSTNMIAICREKLKAADSKIASRTRFEVGDICRKDGHEESTKGTYDMVLAFNLLYLLENPPAAYDNINGLLKPGGLFISKNIVRDRETWKTKFLSAVVPVLYYVGFAPRVVAMQTTAQLESSIEKSGFEISEAVFPKGDEEKRYLVARKIKEV